MPRNPDKRMVHAQLTADEYKVFRNEAERREWSDMKLAEVIIRAFVRSEKKEETIANGLRVKVGKKRIVPKN